MPIVAFLSRMTIDEIRRAICNFSREYSVDWQRWQQCSGMALNGSRVETFGSILRKWQATRPNPMRRSKRENAHSSPFLDDLIEQAAPFIKQIDGVSLRTLENLQQSQADAMSSLWNTFSDLTSRGRATCVGITKAIMLLTDGRIGPAFDSIVRRKLGISAPASATTWLEALKAIGSDLKTFEERNGCQIETLVPEEWVPLNVGRVYDMIAGPRYR